jgi:hypothetical protein
MGRPKVMSPVHSIRITVKLIVILTVPPNWQAAPINAYFPTLLLWKRTCHMKNIICIPFCYKCLIFISFYFTYISSKFIECYLFCQSRSYTLFYHWQVTCFAANPHKHIVLLHTLYSEKKKIYILRLHASYWKQNNLFHNWNTKLLPIVFKLFCKTFTHTNNTQLSIYFIMLH